MNHRNYRKNILFAVIGLMSITAVWQFYEFVTFKDATGLADVQGGRLHLWWAVGLGLIACVSAFFFFSSFLRYDGNNEMHITSPPSGRR